MTTTNTTKPKFDFKESWKKNKEVIMCTATIGSIATLIVCGSINKYITDKLTCQLVNERLISACMFDSKCRPLIENLDFKTQQKKIRLMAEVYYLQSPAESRIKE